MSAYLKVVNGRDRKAEFPLNRSLINFIGRGRECHIQLGDPRASRIHAKLIFEDGGWTITDSGSRNGTQVNGSKIDSAVLSDGSSICIGDSELVFLLSDAFESVTWEEINAEEAMIPVASSEFFGSDSKDFGLKAFDSLRVNGFQQELSALHEFTLRSNHFKTKRNWLISR